MLHTLNDARRLGRSLETLYPCDDILIIDSGSTDQTLRIAREYGARIIPSRVGSVSTNHGWVEDAGWLLCLDVRESLTEATAASLFEWKASALMPAQAFSFLLREETAEGWIADPHPQTRLVPSNWNKWEGVLPGSEPAAIRLDGEVLRFAFP